MTFDTGIEWFELFFICQNEIDIFSWIFILLFLSDILGHEAWIVFLEENINLIQSIEDSLFVSKFGLKFSHCVLR